MTDSNDHSGIRLQDFEPPIGDREKIIHIKGLVTDQPEYAHLQASGISDNEIHSGLIPRGKLLDAGYVFLNRIGGGEKPLLNATIPIKNNEINLAPRILLTQAELAAVFTYQAQHPDEYGSGGLAISEVRQDMLAFLHEAETAQKKLPETCTTIFLNTLKKIGEDPLYEEDRQRLSDFLEQKYYQGDKISTEISYLLKECLAGLNILTVRDIPIEIMSSRRSALVGTPSPFLDSGFHFDTNYDVTLFPNDKTKTVRLNTAVIHLLSRGLNEMGGAINNSHDQTYITSGQWVRDIFPQRPTDDFSPISTISNMCDIIAVRLLARAYIYFKLPWQDRPFATKSKV